MRSTRPERAAPAVAAPPKLLPRLPAPAGSANVREADRMGAKAARTREILAAARRREAELEKQGYSF